MTLESGHHPGTVPVEPRASQGRRNGSPVHTTAAPGWPRLLSLELAALYLGVSIWVMREYVDSEAITPVALPRPNTRRMHRHRPVSDSLRRLLIDRADLDALVEAWKERMP